MKAELITPQTTFKTVAIVLTFETQDELDAFGALFNHCPVCAALERLTDRSVNDEAIRDAITKAGGSTVRLHGTFSDFMKEEYQ